MGEVERKEGELITIHARSTYGVGGDFITFRPTLPLYEAPSLLTSDSKWPISDCLAPKKTNAERFQ